MDKAYNHKAFEDEIYKKWEASGSFTPKIEEGKKPFVISMPPPNVTGKLHIGHGLVVALEDIMIRYHRMKGEPTLWLPGTDHAGIATQSVVEKHLLKEGLRRRDLGREKFIERVWQWKEEYGHTITGQIRKIGASCDWTRERFTFDEGLSEAVKEAFVNLYEKGLIYRGEYIVNWCPKCGTAISDDEVEHKTQGSKLYFFKYDKDFPITIATTRPETKLGDSAVAVNVNDPRYKEFVGKEFDIDLDGVKRKIKIIADRTIDKDFGTGAVGVTPAHSMTDWRLAEEHNLEKIKVIDEYGRIINTNEKYDGLKVSEAREKILEYLKNEGLLEKEEDFENNLSVCYRCGGAIEPLPSLQWFVKMKPLAEKAKKAVESGEIKILPKRFEKVYFHWMDNIRDWCISRQLWWGHRIPVWYKGDKIYVGKEAPEGEGWVQEEDVLDTWFSSGLWPFSTLGWPKAQNEEFRIKNKEEISQFKNESINNKLKIENEKCESLSFDYAPGLTNCDYDYFFPTTVMETGYDILFFWVARMTMMSLELTGKVPFKTVYLHGLVRDEQNRKMSKSLGNVIDPIDIIEKYGADALRFSLVVGSTPGQDMALGESKIKGYRNFSNKIWNITRFVITNLENIEFRIENTDNFSTQDKEDLTKLDELIKKVTKLLDEFKFSQAGELLYDYTWHEFADKIIEQEKERLYGEDENEKQASLLKLTKILKAILTMLHPYMPFVTEACWQELPDYLKEQKLLISSSWPK